MQVIIQSKGRSLLIMLMKIRFFSKKLMKTELKRDSHVSVERHSIVNDSRSGKQGLHLCTFGTFLFEISIDFVT